MVISYFVPLNHTILITIIDYKTGNLSSVANMIKKAGGQANISCDPTEIAQATKLILPGVGHYDFGMRNLIDLGLLDVLNKKALVEKIPVLGICLGSQLLMKGSEEGKEPGLGWINGFTRAFDKSKLSKENKIPHMGWSDVNFKATSKLFTGFLDTPRFYFVHSYHIVCSNPSDELVYCNYGYDFVAGVEQDNILGVQFHPEKSHKFGMRLLANFMEKY